MLSCSCLREDSLLSISLFLFVAGTLVEFRGTPAALGVCIMFGLNCIDFCTACGEMTPLFVLICLTVLRWSLRLYEFVTPPIVPLLMDPPELVGFYVQGLAFYPCGVIICCIVLSLVSMDLG